MQPATPCPGDAAPSAESTRSSLIRRTSSGGADVLPGISYLQAASGAPGPQADEAVAAPPAAISKRLSQVNDNSASFRPGASPLPSPPPARVASLEDFDLLSVLGRGTYGRVLLVRHIASSEVYAMKVFDKRQLVKMKQVTYTRVERNIMTRVNHPFLVDLKFCFQSPDQVCCIGFGHLSMFITICRCAWCRSCT